MAPVPGGALGLLTILAGLGFPALFIVMVRKTFAGFRTGEIRYRGKLDRKTDAAFDYWISMLLQCVGTLCVGAIGLVFFTLALVLIRQMMGR